MQRPRQDLAADDAHQEGVLAALARFGPDAERAPELERFARAVARNKCIDASRRRPTHTLLVGPPDPDADEEHRASTGEEAGRLHARLRHLPRVQAWTAFLHQLGARWDTIQLVTDTETEHAARCALTRARAQLSR